MWLCVRCPETIWVKPVCLSVYVVCVCVCMLRVCVVLCVCCVCVCMLCVCVELPSSSQVIDAYGAPG